MKLIALIVLCTGLSAFGQTSNTIRATSGQLSDVRAAVNAAREGDTVIIPRGTFTWSGQLAINGGTFSDGSPKGKSVNLFGEGGDVTILNNYKVSSTFAEQILIKVQTSPGATFEIKGINFVEGPVLAGSGSKGHGYLGVAYRGYWGQSADAKNLGKVLLVHDCNFTSKGNISWMLRLENRGGVIWNCVFTGAGTGSENGILYQARDNGLWRQPSTMGALDTTGLGNTYVEDCTFIDKGNGYALDVSGGARMVIRHCKFNASMIGSHGLESDPTGMRHAEVYDCTFFNPGTYTWIHVRGGTWAIYGNSFAKGPGSAIIFTITALNRRAVQLSPPCPTKYPIPRQIGQGWAGGPGSFAYEGYPQYGDGNILDPVYIWQNTNNAGSLIGFTDDVDTCGNKLRTVNFVLANRDYFAGVQPKPGYSAFPYPHPLRSATPPPATAVPTFVQSAKGTIPPSATTTNSASFTSQNAGNSNIVVVSFGSTSLPSITPVPTITVRDSQLPNVPYTQVSAATQVPAGTGSVGFLVFRRNGVSAGPNTITVTSNVANELLNLGVLEYAHAGGPVADVASGASSTGTAVSLASAVNGGNKLILAAVANWFHGPGNPTSGGFTTRLNFFKMNLSERVTSAAGPVSITYTIPVGVGWIGRLIAFEPLPAVPTFVQSAKGTIPPSATTTNSASFTSQNAGNSNIVVVSFGSTSLPSITPVPTITVRDSQLPNVPYTQVSAATQVPAGTGSVGFLVFRRNGVSAGPNTITVTSNVANQFLNLGVLEYAHAGGPVADVASGASSTGTAVSLASAVNGGNKLILAAVANWFHGPGNPTSGGFTTRLNFFKMNLSERVTSAAGPVSITYTIPVGVGWIGRLIAFDPS